ncbi:Uncharacterised protein [Mycobacteroides abscessus subsp. abscessus]|nr:Uncharacterised protein [Mycobacteroides abscessus subsp. abscessus]
MPTGQRDDHERGAVGTDELLPVLPEDRIADAFATDPVDHHLRQEAEIPGGRQGHVLQWDADLLALATAVAVAERRRHRQRQVQAARHIPGCEHVIHRRLQFGGSGDQRKAQPRVDGVVHGRAAVGPAGHLGVDQVGPQRAEGLVGMPLPARDIGDEDAGVDDQPGDQVLTFRCAHVHRDRSLAFVQARPVDALAVVGDGPAVIVRGTADRIDPDDLGAELRQRHPRQGHCDETGDFDDAHTRQRTRRLRHGHLDTIKATGSTTGRPRSRRVPPDGRWSRPRDIRTVIWNA